MGNIFINNDETYVLGRLQTLKLFLEDYMEAFPGDGFMHEAWLNVISKIDDFEQS
jgi:hypothetical protein